MPDPIANITDVTISDNADSFSASQTYAIAGEKPVKKASISDNADSFPMSQTYPIAGHCPIDASPGGDKPDDFWEVQNKLTADKLNETVELMDCVGLGWEWERRDAITAARLNQMCVAAKVATKEPVKNWYPWRKRDVITAERLNDMIIASGGESSFAIKTTAPGVRETYPIYSPAPITEVNIAAGMTGSRETYPIYSPAPITAVSITTTSQGTI
jgi:hypothetical protein